MSLVVTGAQFVHSSTTESYTITGILGGDTLSSVLLPDGWSINTTGAIGGGSQTFIFNIGIGSGTIVIAYTNSGSVYLDVFCDSCKMGEEIKQDGVIFVPTVVIPPPIFCDVCESGFTLPIFVNPPLPNDVLNNDKTGFYYNGNAAVASITMVLQQYVGGAWTDVETIIDNTFGNFFDYGNNPDFSGNPFIDDFNSRYTGIFLEWLKVYTIHGIGNYRMKSVFVDIFSVTSTFYSKAQYCVKVWNCHNTDGTVKIEIFNSGLRGTLDDNTVQIDYSSGWADQIRLRGIFKSENYTYTKEYNQYGDSEFNAYKPIINEQTPKYKLQIKPVPGWIDWYLSTNVLQADSILITDFNSKNRHTFVQVPVINDADVTIVNEEYKNPLATVELKFSYGQNSLRKRNN